MQVRVERNESGSASKLAKPFKKLDWEAPGGWGKLKAFHEKHSLFEVFHSAKCSILEHSCYGLLTFAIIVTVERHTVRNASVALFFSLVEIFAELVDTLATKHTEDSSLLVVEFYVKRLVSLRSL